MVNVCQKGKRVERDLVNYLKGLGCPSARRTAQNCGKPTEGSTGKVDNSDVVVPDELPNWHIESKGTAKPLLAPNILKKWLNQIQLDTPMGKVPVILHVANGKSPVAILTLDVFKAVAGALNNLYLDLETPFKPAQELEQLVKKSRIFASISGRQLVEGAEAVAFEVEPGLTVIAIPAPLWVTWALAYEQKVKAAQEAAKEELAKLNEAPVERPKLECVK